MTEDKKYWTYEPEFIDSSVFDLAMEELQGMVKSYTNVIYGKEYPSRRMSCVFTTVPSPGDTNSGDGSDNDNSDNDNTKSTSSRQVVAGRPSSARSAFFSYNNLPTYDWSTAPVTSWLREQVEDYCQNRFDYTLVHLYRDGEDKIDRHNDKEGLNSSIASLSLGATRKFRFQKLGIKSGCCQEYLLNSGDLLVMKVGCQKYYEHWVPVEKTVKTPRLNFTFRTHDK